MVLRDEIKVIPEGLAGELLGGGGQQARQRGLAIPVSKLEFARGLDSAVEGGEEEILADREPLLAFGKVAVEEFDEPDLLSEIVEGDDIAKSGDRDRVG